MRRSCLIALLLPVLAFVVAACGKDEPVRTPVACESGADVWTEALLFRDSRQLEGETPISACIPPDQTAADQEPVGLIATEVASILAAHLQREVPRLRLAADRAYGPGPLGYAEALGYLVGSLERGSNKSQGIHATLVNRVKAAASNRLDSYPEAVQESWQRGYEAGLESG